MEQQVDVSIAQANVKKGWVEEEQKGGFWESCFIMKIISIFYNMIGWIGGKQTELNQL